ncbi:MAG: glycoside hydrolase family 2 protein, partial [Kiritimatiellia bacterium]
MAIRNALGWAMAFVVGSAYAVSLDGRWELRHFPQPDFSAVRELADVPADAAKLPATVPGDALLELEQAGVVPPLFTGTNVWAMRCWENRQWLYSRSFVAPRFDPARERAVLRFDGLDTLADVFLNGKKIASPENMQIAHRLDVTDVVRGGASNEVAVLFRSPVLEAEKYVFDTHGFHSSGSVESEPLRKACHQFGWDIFPRLISAGIWRSAALDIEPRARVDDVYWITSRIDLPARSATLRVEFKTVLPFRERLGASYRITLSREGKTAFERTYPLETVATRRSLGFGNVAFWWPKSYGEPALYEAKIQIIGGVSGETIATDVRKIGVRTVTLERDDVYSAERPGEFLFRVNGEKIYCRGSNWVPLDMMHSRDTQHLIPTLELFSDLNCNMVRVWGGGVYESDAFYDYCDANGLLVWQDFMTGCGCFPQDDAYAAVTDAEIRSVLLRLRNHASIALWAGNNENDQFMVGEYRGTVRIDPNVERNSRVTIPRVCWELDPVRPYLPSSEYYSPDVAAGLAQPSENHLWGARGYYKVPFYTNSPAHFVSEMGYHGMPNRSTLERMMTKEGLYPFKDAKFTAESWNDEYQCKASRPFVTGDYGKHRNHLMSNQVQLMFGTPSTDLDVYIDQSQVVQAEAMKTFVELFRSRKFARTTGLLWWNVRDGWPQLSDAVVDYFYSKKLAYWTIRNAQRDQIVMVRDDHRAIAVNDTRAAVAGSVVVRDAVTGKVVLERAAFTIPAN